MSPKIEELMRANKWYFTYKVSRFGGKVHLYVFSDHVRKPGSEEYWYYTVIVEEDEINGTIKVCKEK